MQKVKKDNVKIRSRRTSAKASPQASAEFFKENKYVAFSKVIDGQILDFFYSYIQIFADRFEIVGKHLPKYYNEHEHGWIYPPGWPAAGSFSKYGDMLAETLLLSIKKNIEDRIGLELIPTYGFFRLYKKGNDLELHKDRNSCEISLSLCIGYEEGEQWPLYINETPIYQEPGDMVIYRGCEVEHYREPYEGKQQAQVFLHYVDKNGPYGGEEFIYDGRPFVGLPVVYVDWIYEGTPFFEGEKIFNKKQYDENTE